MRIYKHNVLVDGKKQESPRWYTDIYLVKGQRKRLPLFESRKLSLQFADKLDVMIGQHESPGGYDRDIQDWINQLSPAMIQKLSKMGLVSTQRAESGKPINDHIDEWRDALLAGGTGKKHADQNHHRVTRIFTEAGFRSLADITADKVTLTIGQLQTTVHKKNKKSGKVELTETGVSSSFLKLHHLRAVKQFTKWTFINGRLTDDPLKHLTVKNVRVENQRRALSVDELTYLLAFVEASEPIWNVPGPERALVYELAVNTGLRRDEIKSLKRTSFDFERLSVRVDAIDTKNKKAALLPVKTSLMDKIKRHLSGKMPTAKAFNIPDASAKMICKDMIAARKKWIDAVKEDDPEEHQRRNDSDFLKVVTHQGKIDFHSLRHTFGTLLAESGVHPKVAMDLMRHSDINLTMALYTHSNQEQAIAAIDAIPSFEVPKEAQKQA